MRERETDREREQYKYKKSIYDRKIQKEKKCPIHLLREYKVRSFICQNHYSGHERLDRCKSR